MNKSDVAGLLALGAALGFSQDQGYFPAKHGENPYRLRNKTAHGIARKAKNKAARKSRLRNR